MKNLFRFLHFLFKGIMMICLIPAALFAIASIFRFKEVFFYDYSLHDFELFIISLIVIYTNYSFWIISEKEDLINEEKERRRRVEKECNKRIEEHKERIIRVNACVEYMRNAIKKEFPLQTRWKRDDTVELKIDFDQYFRVVKEERAQCTSTLNELFNIVEAVINKAMKEFSFQTEYRIERKDAVKHFGICLDLYFKEIVREKSTLRQILQSSSPFDKVASLCADAETAIFDIERRRMLTKTRPAISSAEKVRQLKTTAKEHITAYKAMLYKYEFLLSQFPELDKYIEGYEAIKSITSIGSLSEARDLYDKTKDWVSKEEYGKLSENERNQLALDRYVNSSKKSKWQIGRDYELYVGYLFRKEGWNVIQFGIEKKLKDMGRDLIVSKTRKDGLLGIRIVQCKIWSKEKEIHENAICQLFGTTVQYIIEQNMIFKDANERVKPLFVTTTELSDTASKFAKTLGVEVKTLPMGDFPRIKCNISKTGEKIYHLPFDQQYDTTVIDYSSGEFYAFSVEEATSKGFRRAFKYHKP